MPSYAPPKKNAEYIFYVALASQANANTFQSNPTLAAGDAKVSIDGGALNNLATLPAVTPASSKMVKVTLSASEMNGDNITVVLSDASGAEWRDLVVNLQTAARLFDDLAYPTTTGRSIDVSATGEVGIDWANIGAPTTTVNLANTSVNVGSVAANALTASALATDAVNEIADGVLNRAITEPSGVFAWSGASLRAIIAWLGALGRNKITQTSTTSTLRNDADNASLSTSTVSDDGTTFTRGEWS